MHIVEIMVMVSECADTGYYMLIRRMPATLHEHGKALKGTK